MLGPFSRAQAAGVFERLEKKVALKAATHLRGLQVAPRPFFCSADEADLDRDGAYSRAELITAVPKLFYPADISRRARVPTCMNHAHGREPRS